MDDVLSGMTFGAEFECYIPDFAGYDVDAARRQFAAAITTRLEGMNQCHPENYNHRLRSHWKLVHDSSLEDPRRGIEVVSPKLQGDAGLEEVRRTLGAVVDYGCTVTKKNGMHVHVGVGDNPSIEFWRRLVKLYVAYEPIIDGFIPPSRRGSSNGYCRTLTHMTARRIDSCHSLQDLIRLVGSDHMPARNRKLNLEAYYRHQTVEFRQHAGTTSYKKARNWILFCLRMVAAAKAGRTTVDRPEQAAIGQVNTARRGTKRYDVGQMLLRPEGVSRDEIRLATGWPTVSVQDVARSCGLTVVSERIGRRLRYFARTAQDANAAPQPTTANQLTLEGLFQLIGCDADEQEYFRMRTRNLSGGIAWAA